MENPKHLVAGCISGLASCVALQPLDLLKTRIQQLRSQSITSTAFTVIQNDGVLGLWKGTLPTILRNVPGSGMYFLCLHLLRTGFTGHVNADTANLASGMLARVSVGFILMPITIVKVRYESNLFKYNSIFGSFKAIVKENGIRGLFAGFGATALRDAPFAGIYVYFYENCKQLINSSCDMSRPVVSMTAGILGGSAATAITQPFDLIKTRVQLEPEKYKNMFHAFKRVMREEGIHVLWKGALPRILRKSLSSAISWTVYEEIINRRT